VLRATSIAAGLGLGVPEQLNPDRGAGPKRLRGALRLALLFAALVGPGAPQAFAASAPGVVPNAMRGLGAAQRIIEIAATSMHTTHATARTYQLEGGRWRPVRDAMPARLGYNGLSRPGQRHEGDGTTPIGDYGFVYDFGSRPNPGVTGFRWRRLVPGSCWAGTRADYNRWVERRPCAPGDEDLWSNHALAYRYAAVIDFNYRDPIYGRGSGIFLHEQTGGPTAGCISLRQADLLSVLRWMRPATRILIGPSSWLRSLKTARPDR
jgi:L,D-peptidoglycan transpeptidase YkuD (ErfK/YbiS/YcfS/YnhG family)